MRILMATYMPYYRSEKEGILSNGSSGGQATSAFNLAKALIKEGIHVEIISPCYRDYKNEVQGVPVIWSKELQSNFKNNWKTMGTVWLPTSHHRYRKIFSDIFRQGIYDLYHGHGHIFSVGPVFAARDHKIPSLVTVHGFWPLCLTGWRFWNGDVCKKCSKIRTINCLFQEGLDKLILSPLLLALQDKTMAVRREGLEKADKIVTVSNYMKHALVKAGFAEEKIHIIYNSFIPFEAQQRSHKKHELYICWAGGIVKEKGLIYLFRAFTKIIKKYPELKLYIIGDSKPGFSSEKKRLIKFAIRENISHSIVFTGWVSHEDTRKKIGQSLAVVFPSIGGEAMGLVVLEGMASGRPVIGTNCGGIPDMIKDWYNGMLVLPRDSDKLAEKILYLLDNPSEVERMGKNALKTANEEFNPKTIAKKHIELYEELMDQRSKTRIIEKD